MAENDDWDEDGLPPAPSNDSNDNWSEDSLPAAPDSAGDDSPATVGDMIEAGDVKGLVNKAVEVVEDNVNNNPMYSDEEKTAEHIAENPSDASTFVKNAGEESKEWAEDTLADAGDLIEKVRVKDESDYTPYNDPTGNRDEKTAEQAAAAEKVYDDTAKAAGNIAVTPGVPGPIRAAAGAYYLPELFGNIQKGYTDNVNDGQTSAAAAGNTAYDNTVGIFTNPFKRFFDDPKSFKDEIVKDPSKIFGDVLLPGAIAHGAVNGAEKLADRKIDKTIDEWDENSLKAADSTEDVAKDVDRENTEDSQNVNNTDYKDSGDSFTDEPPVNTAAENNSTGTDVDAGFVPYDGVTMDNGTEGCAEAVGKIGANYSGFLKNERDNGVVYVPDMVADAGDKYIPFDDSKLQKGDVIVYGDNDHVVIYDGNGGYYGNSSGLNKVVHGSDYTEMGDLVPTGIIKTGTGDTSHADFKTAADDLGDFDLGDTTAKAATERTNNADTDAFGDSLNKDSNDFEKSADLTDEDKKADDNSFAGLDNFDAVNNTHGISQEEVLRRSENPEPETTEPTETTKIVEPEPAEIKITEPKLSDYVADLKQQQAKLMNESADNPEIGVIQNKIDNAVKFAEDKGLTETPEIKDTQLTETPEIKDTARTETETPVTEDTAKTETKTPGAEDDTPLSSVLVSKINNNLTKGIYDIRSGIDDIINQHYANADARDNKRTVSILPETYAGTPVSKTTILGLANHDFPQNGGSYIKTRSGAKSPTYDDFNHVGEDIGDTLVKQRNLVNKAGDKYYALLTDGDSSCEEGIAHAINTYICNPLAAAEKYGDYIPKLKRDLGSDIVDKLDRLGYKIRQWHAQPAGLKVESSIKDEYVPTRKDKALKNKDKTMTDWVDKLDAIERAEKDIQKVSGEKITNDESAYVAARECSDKAVSIANQLINGKKMDKAKNAINRVYGADVIKHGVSLRTAVQKLAKTDKETEKWLEKNGLTDAQDGLSTYLAAKAAVEQHDVNDNKYWRTKTAASYADCYNLVKYAPASIKAAAASIYHVRDNVLCIARHGGLISDAMYKKIKTESPHGFILDQSFDSDEALVSALTAGFNKNYNGTIDTILKRGSKDRISDPISTIAKNVYKIVNLAERNTVANIFIKNIDKHDVQGLYTRVPHKGRNTISVWQNDELGYYQVTPEVKAAMDCLGPKNAQGFLDSVLSLPARLMRSTSTGSNPFFILKNIIRDVQTAKINSHYDFSVFDPVFKGVVGMFKGSTGLDKTGYWDEFKTAGVQMSTIINATKDYVGDMIADNNRSIVRKAAHYANPLAAIEAMGNAVECTTRYAAYVKAREAGASIKEAVYEARNITIDFGKSGVKGQTVNKYVPFFNAAIQDPALLLKNIKANPKTVLYRAALAFTLPTIVEEAMILSNDENKKEYDKLPSYQKNNFWNLPVGKTPFSQEGWLQVPKAFGPGLLFGSLPERIIDRMQGRDPNGMKNWAKDFAGAMTPSVIPTVLQLPIEVYFNKSFFYGGNIISDRLAKKPNAEQYAPGTSNLSRGIASGINGAIDNSSIADMISKGFNISKNDMQVRPAMVEHVGEGLGTAAYKLAGAVTDSVTGKKNIDWAKTVYGYPDPYKSSQTVQDFYDLKTDLEQKHAEFKQNHKTMSKADGSAYAKLKTTEKTMSRFTKQIQAATEAGDTDEVKRLKKAQDQFCDSFLKHVR